MTQRSSMISTLEGGSWMEIALALARSGRDGATVEDLALTTSLSYREVLVVIAALGLVGLVERETAEPLRYRVANLGGYLDKFMKVWDAVASQRQGSELGPL